MKISRLTLVTFLILFSLSAYAATTSCNPFIDVDSNTQYCSSIKYLKDEGVVSGYSDNTFKPYNSISRIEFTKIVIGATFDSATIDDCLSSTNNATLFSDTNNTEWYAKYLCTAKKNGVIGGYSDGTFKPSNEIAFSEASKILAVSFDLNFASSSDPWYKTYVDALADQKAIPSTIDSFDQKLNRSEMAEIVYRLKNPDTSRSSETYDSINSAFPDFAIYDPSTEDDGVWEEEVTALKAMMDLWGYSYDVVDADDINSQKLYGSDGAYKAIVMPGGYAYTRSAAITRKGKTHLRDFVNNGGNYLGFCAGAYFPAGTIDFALETSGGGGTYNLETDYVDYSKYYNNDILTFGKIRGPFGWFPWNDGLTLNYEMAKINSDNATMKTIGLSGVTRFPYGGGPFFEIDENNKPDGYEVWAYTVKPDTAPSDANIGDNAPAVIKYNLGAGTVILSSYHPTILVGSDLDNVYLSQYYQEGAIEWKMGDQTQDEINYNSWNLVHAAMQIVTNERVTKLESL